MEILENLPFFWSIIGLILLIVEIVTGTFFSLSAAIPSFILAGYFWFFPDTEFRIIHFILLLIGTVVFVFVFLNFFQKKKEEKKFGIDTMVGKKIILKKVGNTWKAEIFWVDYWVRAEEENMKQFSEGEIVIFSSYKNGVVFVKKDI